MRSEGLSLVVRFFLAQKKQCLDWCGGLPFVVIDFMIRIAVLVVLSLCLTAALIGRADFFCYNTEVKKSSFLLIALCLGLFLPTALTLAASKPIIAGWIPYWKKTGGVAEATANLNKLSEISPFSYTVSKTGALIDTVKIGSAPWPKLFAQARKQQTKVLPSVMWNDSQAIDATLANPTKRLSQITAILAEVKKGGFDGIDIDYENKFASTSPYFSLFLQELGTKLRAQNKILSCTIEARMPPDSRYLVVPKKLEYANDYQALNKYCDEVRLMTYDQGTADIKLNSTKRRGGLYYPVADQAWVRKVVALAIKDISPDKIMIGIPTYGYLLQVTDKNKYFDYQEVKSLSYQDFLKLAKEKKQTPKRNNAGEMYFTFASSSLSYYAVVSDATAIANKYRLAKSLGLRGIALFKIDGESDEYWGKLEVKN